MLETPVTTENRQLDVPQLVREARDMEESRLNILKSHGLDLVIFGDLAWDAKIEARRVGDEEGKKIVAVVGGRNIALETFWENCCVVAT